MARRQRRSLLDPDRGLLNVRTLLVALVLLAPTALAQVPVGQPPSFSVFVEDPGRAFTPGANESVTVVISYGPGQGGRPTPNPSLDNPENTTPTRITFEAKGVPSWVTAVTFDPPELEVDMHLRSTGDLTKSTYTLRTIAILSVAPDAPALERESFIVVATAAPNGSIPGATAESPDLKVRAATVGALNVTSDPLAILPGGRWTDVPFAVTNVGNSAIIAKVNVTVRPENSQVDHPTTLQLKRGEMQIVNVRIRTPWTNAEFGTLTLEAVPILDGEEGKPASFEVDVRGTSAAPAPSLGAIVLGLALLALARRSAR